MSAVELPAANMGLVEVETTTPQMIEGPPTLNKGINPNGPDRQPIQQSKIETHQHLQVKSKEPSFSVQLKSWLAQSPAEEPFNLVGWGFECLWGQFVDTTRLNHMDDDPDGWSLDGRCGSGDGKGNSGGGTTSTVGREVEKASDVSRA